MNVESWKMSTPVSVGASGEQARGWECRRFIGMSL